jgi:GntR family transcriptional regulator
LARKKKAKRTRPLYQKTADALETLLEGLAPGTFLPSEPDLAKKMGVSRATLREAMRPLEAKGRIVRRQGVGTYVVEPPQVIETGLEVLTSINALASRMGMTVKMKDLEITVRRVNGPDDSPLHTPRGGQVVDVSRVMVAEDRPVAYLVDSVPDDILTAESLKDDFRGSVLEILRARGEPQLDRSQAEITATTATHAIARSLGIQRGDVLLYLEARLFDTSGRVVDHSRSYFLPGTFRFHVVRRVDNKL